MIPPHELPPADDSLSDADALRLAAIALGVLLLHSPWEKKTARDMGEILGIAMRTGERWANGTRPVPPAVWRDIAEAMRERGHSVIARAAEIEERAERPTEDPPSL